MSLFDLEKGIEVRLLDTYFSLSAFTLFTGYKEQSFSHTLGYVFRTIGISSISEILDVIEDELLDIDTSDTVAAISLGKEILYRYKKESVKNIEMIVIRVSIFCTL